jgi:integrase
MAQLSDVQLRQWVRSGAPIAGKSDGGGLTFTLSKSGTAAWVFRYRIGGKQREVTLGTYPTISVKRARELATETRARVQQGVDVARVKQEEKTALTAAGTVKELCDEYFIRTIQGRVKRPQLVRDKLDNDIIRQLGRARIADVKPMDIDRMIRGIVERGSPIMANRVLSLTKSLFDYAIRRHWIEQNPATAFRRDDAGGEEKGRQRALSDAEISKLFAAFKDAGTGFRIYDLATRLLLVTAVRKAELIEAPWSEFDLDSGLWAIPKTRIKVGRDFTVPLPAVAVEWLREIKALAPTSDYVFPARRTRKKNLTMSPETVNWAVSEIEHKVDHFTLHDLRRTARTQLAALGIAPHVAERCLNHKLPGINDVYDTHDYLTERKAALTLWGLKLDKLIKGEPFNVISLDAARGVA